MMDLKLFMDEFYFFNKKKFQPVIRKCFAKTNWIHVGQKFYLDGKSNWNPERRTTTILSSIPEKYPPS